MRFLFPGLLLLVLCVNLHAQSERSEIRPGVGISSAVVLDSAGKKAVGNISVSVISSDTTRVLKFNARGTTGGADAGIIFFQNAIPDSMRFTSANENYRVTGWKIKNEEWGDVVDAKGKKTGKKWWLVQVTIYVTKNTAPAESPGK